MAYVHVEAAVKYFPREDGSDMLVLDGVSFDTKEFGITCLLGPSGCGKSTLLNAISGLEKLDGGRIEVMSNNGAAKDRPPRLGYVFQDARLLNWKSVERNLAFALKGMSIAQAEWPERLGKYLDLVGLARGLVIEPEVLLMDEPFSKLDQLTARRLREETLRICDRLKQTTVLVTHDVEEAAYMGDRVVILCARPARIVEVFENPLPPGRRDVDDAQFIQFKKTLLQSVLQLMETGEV